MPRRPVLTLAAVFAAVSVLSFTTAGCSSSGGEQQVLRKYFEANKLRDQSTVANMATVEFDPQTDGIVQRFSVVSVSDDQRTTLNIKQYAEEWKAAREENEAFTKEINAFQKENAEEIDRVARAASTKGGLRGKDAELHAAWQKWVSDRAEHTKKVQDSRRRLAAETRIAEVSAFDARKPIDVAEYEGELITKDVTIDARVLPPGGGEPQDRRYVVTLQRSELRGPDGDRSGRWIVTDIKRAS
jgi:hypothetical protein